MSSKKKEECAYPNGHSFFNLEMKNEKRITFTQTAICFSIWKRKIKNELDVPKRPNIEIKSEKEILAGERFFLQMQKGSSKTSFGLNKFYLRIHL